MVARRLDEAAFGARVRDEAQRGGVRTIGSKPRRVTRLFYKLDSVGWLTDRRRHLYVVDLDGGEPRQVTDGDCEDGAVVWSPDGARLVFSALRGERWDTKLANYLYVVGVEGGEPELLSPTDGSYGQPRFSPDVTADCRIASAWKTERMPHHSTRLASCARRLGRAPVLTTLASTASARRLPGESREPVWDGDRIVFSLEDGGNVHPWRGRRRRLRVTRARSSVGEQIDLRLRRLR